MSFVASVQEKFDNYEIKQLAEKFSTSEIVIETLFKNNIKTEPEINKFLHPSLEDLHNPFLLNGMSEAVEKIEEHIKNKSKIIVYGDYDVDGISAVTVLYNYFCSRGANIKYFIPSRSDDDYGLNVDTLKVVVEKFKPDLLITVDCGISCYEEVEFLKSVNVDCIVTDHHDIPEKIPNTIVIDPKIPGQSYPFCELCGAGVAYKLAVALNGGKEIESLLSVVALATVADIVPLVDENRALVHFGLEYSEKYMPRGILKLCKKLGIEKLTSHDISFKVSPRINAPGRLGSPLDSLNLFLEKNPEKINTIIEKMEKINEERQNLCAKTYNDVVEILNKQVMAETYAIVLKSKNWHAGILGIVCARICEEFSRPVFLFSENEDGLLKGSGRSVGEIDIGNVLRHCCELFVKFGGHAAAVGIKIKDENFDKFKDFANEFIKNEYSTDAFETQKFYDFELSPQDFTLENFNSLEILEPFGHSNPKPIFKVQIGSDGIKNFNLVKTHLAIRYSKVNAIGFNMAKFFKQAKCSDAVELLLDCEINEYRGKKSVKGIIKAIQCNLKHNLISECEEKEYLINNIPENCEIKVNKFNENEFYEKLNSALLKTCWGVLVIAGTNKGFNAFCGKISQKINIEFETISSRGGINTLLLSPRDLNFENYNEIFVLDEFVNGFNLPLKLNNSSEVFVGNKQSTKILQNVKTDRDTFVSYYTLIHSLLQRQNAFNSFQSMFYALKKVNPQFPKISFEQFYVCLKCFVELNIFKIEKNDNDFVVEKNNINTDLNNATLLALIKRYKGE